MSEHQAPPDTFVGRRLAALQEKEATRKTAAAARAAPPQLSNEEVAQLQARAKRWRREPARRARFISKTADFAMLKLEREMRRSSGKEFRDSLKQFMAVALLAQGATAQPEDEKE